ncbi:hypothetical protein [Thiolapillus sp.]|nr:hypothetical protein [Thiolapillus sp.]
MDCNQILLLGLGIEAPWKLVEQRLDYDLDYKAVFNAASGRQ